MSERIEKIAVIVPGILPVPPSRGGAVENLLYNIVQVNEEKKKIRLLIYSIYDNNAVQDAVRYANTEWKFYKTPALIKWCDNFIYMLAKMLGRNNVQSYRFIGQRLYYIYKIAQDLHKRDDVDKIILDNHVTLCAILKLFGNEGKYENRIIYYAHNEVTGYWGMKSIFHGLRKYICVSRFIGTTLRKKGIAADKISVVKNVVDTKRFAARMTETEGAAFREKYGISRNDFVVFTAGRIVPEKGIKEALLGFKLAGIENAKFVLAGGIFFDSRVKNEYGQEVKEIIREMPDRVLMTGYISYAEMPRWYQCADVGVFPAIWDEPAGLTVIEARSAGLPVITTLSGGIPEYIQLEHGILLPRDDKLTENIAISLRELQADLTKRKEMGAGAYEYSKQFDLYTYYEDFYRQVTNV